MSAAPTPPPHVPIVIVLAGGGSSWDATCMAALAACGLTPDDFGSYNAVNQRLRDAKMRVMQERYARRPGAPPPSMPTPPVTDHDRLLARSQAGHLAQNAVFQRQRGNSCENVRHDPANPAHAGAYGYSDQHAPCGPHPGDATSRGTTHWGVSTNEARVSQDPSGATRPVNTPVTGAEVSQQARGTALRTAAGATDQDMAGGTNGWDRRRRGAEATAREASAASLGAPASGVAPAGATSSAANANINANAQTAADCIEAFRQAAMNAMRTQVMQDYSAANYPQTEARLRQAEADAQQRVTDTGNRLSAATAARQAAAPNATPQQRYEEARAAMELQQSRADLAGARNALTSAPCLRDQVPQLQQQVANNGGVMPPCSGQTPPPPGTPVGTRRPRYGTTAPTPVAPTSAGDVDA